MWAKQACVLEGGIGRTNNSVTCIAFPRVILSVCVADLAVLALY